jgi:hypothetical protein
MLSIANREGAIARLQADGFYAAPRDWSLGATILTAGTIEDRNGMGSVICGLYLYPLDHGRWGISQGMIHVMCSMNLSECVRVAELLMRSCMERKERFCSACYPADAHRVTPP